MRVAKWLYQIGPSDSDRYGSSAVSLAEVVKGGLPTVPTFVIGSEIVQEFLLDPTLRRKITHEVGSFDPKHPQHLQGISAGIRKAIRETKFPSQLRKELAPILDHLADIALCRDTSLPLTLSVEPTDGLESAVSITGETNNWDDFATLFGKVIATQFSAELLHARLQSTNAVLPRAVAVTVRLHHPAQAAGTAQPYDPDQHDGKVLYVTAHFHEDELLAKGEARDIYRFDRDTLLPLSRAHARHRFAVKKDGSHTKIKKPITNQETGVLTEQEQGRLARLIRSASRVYDEPHVFGWVLSGSNFYLTSSSSLKTDSALPYANEDSQEMLPVPLGVGHAANYGTATGPARIISSAADKKRVGPGDVVVLKVLSKGDITWMSQASAIVSEFGVASSAEGMVAMRLGIPAVTSVTDAHRHIHDGQLVTVDGTHGVVYAGRIAPQNTRERHYTATEPVTGTQIHLELKDPLHFDLTQLEGMDGIGLIRGEFLLHMVGVHPRELFEKKRHGEYGEILTEVLERVVRLSYPKTVVYQLHDIHPGTFSRDRHEPNPKLGYRGTHRLLREPSLAELEIETIFALHEKGLDTVRIMLPVVREIEEVMAAQEMIRKVWGENERLPRLWIRCETPAMAESVSDLAALGIEGICFDIPLLTQLMTGVDGDNYQVAHHVDQADPAVLDLIDQAIRTCREEGLVSMVVAEEEDLVPETVQTAVRAGVGMVTVPKEEAEHMRTLVASIEQRVIFERALEN